MWKGIMHFVQVLKTFETFPWIFWTVLVPVPHPQRMTGVVGSGLMRSGSSCNQEAQAICNSAFEFQSKLLSEIQLLISSLQKPWPQICRTMHARSPTPSPTNSESSVRHTSPAKSIASINAGSWSSTNFMELLAKTRGTSELHHWLYITHFQLL